jgi:hypothetical protein
LSESLPTVVNELLTEFLGKLVGFSMVRVAMINVMLHALQERLAGAIDDGDASSSDVTVRAFRGSKPG